jgi:hypothetical protein
MTQELHFLVSFVYLFRRLYSILSKKKLAFIACMYGYYDIVQLMFLAQYRFNMTLYQFQNLQTRIGLRKTLTSLISS